MNVSVLAVGTELLLGQIIDSNSAWMGEELATHGIDSLVQVKVGDNVSRIEAQLRRLIEDADAVIICGGLGPTHDDLTREAIAAVMGADLVLDDDVAQVIRHMFESARSPDAGEQPPPGAGAERRDRDSADPWDRTRPDLPGRRTRPARSCTRCPACPMRCAT